MTFFKNLSQNAKRIDAVRRMRGMGGNAGCRDRDTVACPVDRDAVIGCRDADKLIPKSRFIGDLCLYLVKHHIDCFAAGYVDNFAKSGLTCQIQPQNAFFAIAERVTAVRNK